MQKFWQVKNPNPQKQLRLSDALGIHPIIAQLLINRGISDPKEASTFLSADITQLHDPFLLKDMSKVVKRIHQARDKQERVLVFGDYDVDGVTSSTILNKILKEQGINALHHIPHRQEDGYGLNHSIGDWAVSQKVKLLIAVDCGITAKEEVRILNQLGLEVIVIDHHEPTPERIPDAYAIINPKQKDCPYPFKDLASVGLVGKLAQALAGEMPLKFLDLMAIGTIADIVSLRGENRILVKAGLPQILKTTNVGLRALLNSAKIKATAVSPYHVGFILGPRINAAGRMDSAHGSLDLLLSEDPEKAERLAQILEEHNTQRQRIQKNIVFEAEELLEQEVNFKEHKVIVLGKEGWHKGVLGIVASKLTEKYYRPSIIISFSEGIGTASARSIGGFHLHDALMECSSHLEEFGGHEGAAGLTIKQENIDTFRVSINKLAEDFLPPEKLKPTLSIDCEIPLGSIDMDFADLISSMEPFGEGNPIPVFCTRNLTVKSQPVIMGKETIKFWVADEKVVISAVGFGMAKYKAMLTPGAQIDLAYEIIIDDWNKKPTPQLKIKDLRLSE